MMRVVALLTSLCLPAGGAFAAPLTSAEILNQFNLVVSGDVTSSQEVDGRSYIGGNLKGTTIQVGTKTLPASAFRALTVGGNVSVGTLNVENGNSIAVGGGVTSKTLELNGKGTATIGGKSKAKANQGTVFTKQAGKAGFSDLFPTDIIATLTKTSADLAKLTKTGDAKAYGDKLKFSAATGTAIFNITLATFASIKEIDLNVGSAATLIINVAGKGHAKLEDNFVGKSIASAKNVIWNFFEATSLTFERQFAGSVLAGLADVTNNSLVEGSLFAKSLAMHAEIHLQPFKGTLPAMAAVPLPAGLPLLATAMIGFAALRRRKA